MDADKLEYSLELIYAELKLQHDEGAIDAVFAIRNIKRKLNEAIESLGWSQDAASSAQGRLQIEIEARREAEIKACELTAMVELLNKNGGK